MTLNPRKGARFGLALLGVAAWLVPAAALAAQNGYNSAQPLPNDPLSVNLRILAESPHNVGALIGAGKAALELGDAQGALTFLARAEQDAPRDGWVKKWEGSALVQLEQPAAALRYFSEAVQLGVPEASVAGDRGLAWDITGDPRRAQADYRLALSQGSDPEVTRRLALSLAISGERDQALQLLNDQLQRRDRAAYRTRALVLALSGDWQAADRDVQAELPAPQAAALEPYLAQLPSLSLADRALAVHLGHFPGNGRATAPGTSYAQNSYAQNAQMRQNDLQTSYSRTAEARPNYGGLPAGYQPRPQQGVSGDSLDAEDAEGSRPGFSNAVSGVAPTRSAQTAAARPQPAPVAPALRAQRYEPPVSQWSWSLGDLPSPTTRRAPVKAAAAQAPHSRPAATSRPSPVSAPVRTSPPAPHPIEIADAATPTVPPTTLAATTPPPRSRPEPTFAPAPTAPPESRSRRLAEVVAELDRIEAERRGQRVASAVQPEEDARSARSHAHAAAHKAPPRETREPARHWVQLAHGGSSNLGSVFGRLQDKAPKLLADRTAWIAAGSPNRLVVGPFPSEREAQKFADRLSDEDLTALVWTSDAGQKVEKLSDR